MVNELMPETPENDDYANRWLKATLELTQALQKQTSVRGGLRLVTQRLRVVSGADYVAIGLTDPHLPVGTAFIEVVDGMGFEDVSGNFPHASERSELWTNVIQSNKAVISSDIPLHPGFQPPAELAEALSTLGPGMYLPLAVSGNAFGVLVAGWRRGSSFETISTIVPLMQMFTDVVALALQQVRTHSMVLEDRERIAGELRDTILVRLFDIGTRMHVISGMVGQTEMRRRLQDTINELDGTIRQISATVFALSDARTPSRLPLSAQVLEEVEAVSNTFNQTPRLVVHGPLNGLPEWLEQELVLAVRESLADAATHQAVSNIEVFVQVTADKLALTVSDDGQAGKRLASGSVPVRLRKRARQLGGTCTVRADGPTGNILSWQVPLHGMSD
ncbi:GAF domain-containing sensor histidine kinase [Actinopolymorpha pittospori]|uniref:Signal transduction histidine kinase n=1 Tax=Actinopolymorpha pittospori TaxID=648752 RepID=A0A927RM51_9ACTN|nr:GAF domain-containing sensor histidine kinase [Actinopolymorpha pittospori]MBE1608553.1 signal transduction histidine kinase [Actinopolymorpha pittospori]